MGNWGDDWDPEVLHKQDPKGRYTLNFKKITSDIDKIIAETATVDSKHPKIELLKEWAGVMTAFFLLFLLSYQVLIFATIPFFAFYFIALFRIGNAWKQFKYSRVQYFFMTLGGVIVVAALGFFIQKMIMG